MKGDALLLSRVIAGGRVQFIIPVYQRNYSWFILADRLISLVL